MKRILALLVVLSFAFTLLPCAGSGQSRQQGIRLYNEAQKLRKQSRSKDDLERAVRKHEQAIRTWLLAIIPT